MCSFPASGSSWKSFAREGVAMDDPGCRQGVTLSERGELVPKEPTPASPPRQPFLPNPHDLIGVPAYSSKVARYAVVGIVAPHHRAQMGALIRDRLMPVAPTPVRNRRQRAGETVLCRYLPHHILACPRLAPDVGEAEEGERGTIRLRMVSPIWSAVAEIDEARLVGMECESMPCKALTQNAEDPLGIEEVLERQHGIVSEANKGTSQKACVRRFRRRPRSCRRRPAFGSPWRARGKSWPLATTASCPYACPSGWHPAPRSGSCRHPFERQSPCDDPPFGENLEKPRRLRTQSSHDARREAAAGAIGTARHRSRSGRMASKSR